MNFGYVVGFGRAEKIAAYPRNWYDGPAPAAGAGVVLDVENGCGRCIVLHVAKEQYEAEWAGMYARTAMMMDKTNEKK